LAHQAPPPVPFGSAPDFLKLAADMYLGEVAGVAMDSKGRPFVFLHGNPTGQAYGASASQLLEFGPDAR
jgi:hypothetical protein